MTHATTSLSISVASLAVINSIEAMMVAIANTIKSISDGYGKTLEVDILSRLSDKELELRYGLKREEITTYVFNK